MNLVRQKEEMTLRTSKMSFETNLNLEIARKSENETKKRKRTGKN